MGGASTLAELSVINIPFIAVPLPSSKDNHQLENANFYKENDCCWVIEQTNFESKIEHLLNEILIDKIEYLKKTEIIHFIGIGGIGMKLPSDSSASRIDQSLLPS